MPQHRTTNTTLSITEHRHLPPFMGQIKLQQYSKIPFISTFYACNQNLDFKKIFFSSNGTYPTKGEIFLKVLAKYIGRFLFPLTNRLIASQVSSHSLRHRDGKIENNISMRSRQKPYRRSQHYMQTLQTLLPVQIPFIGFL